MNTEYVTLLDLVDVGVIRLTCGRCRSALSIQIDQTIRVPECCPICHDEWSETVVRAADTLAQAVKQWRLIQQSSFAVHLAEASGA